MIHYADGHLREAVPVAVAGESGPRGGHIEQSLHFRVVLFGKAIQPASAQHGVRITAANAPLSDGCYDAIAHRGALHDCVGEFSPREEPLRNAVGDPIEPGSGGSVQFAAVGMKLPAVMPGLEGATAYMDQVGGEAVHVRIAQHVERVAIEIAILRHWRDGAGGDQIAGKVQESDAVLGEVIEHAVATPVHELGPPPIGLHELSDR